MVGELLVFQRTPPWFGPTPDYHDEVSDRAALALRPRAVLQRVEPVLHLLADGRRRARQRRASTTTWEPKGESVSDDERHRPHDAHRLPRAWSSPTGPTCSRRSCRTTRPAPSGCCATTASGPARSSATTCGSSPTAIREITPDGHRHRRRRGARGRRHHLRHRLPGVEVPHADEGHRPRRRRPARAVGAATPAPTSASPIPGFPNLFCLYGPNTNIVVNGSIVYFSECGVRYILGCSSMLLARRPPGARGPQGRARRVQRAGRRREPAAWRGAGPT